jgi:AcrR family transcriptional regulator
MSNKAKKTEEALFKAAIKVLSQKGINNARISDIVEEACVSHGTFYAYFKNKDDIVYKITSKFLDNLYEVSMSSWDKGGLKDSVRHVLRSFLEVYSKNADVMIILMEGATSGDKILRMLYVDICRRFQQRIKRNLLEASEKGLTKDVNLEIASSALAGIVESFAFHNFCLAPANSTPKLGIDEICDTLTKLWCNSIYKDEALESGL